MNKKPLTMKKVFRTWLPLMASWLLMSLELPLLTAVAARLGDAEINLAAYGGIVYPIALTVEGPVIMLLAASTALSRDWASYQKLKKITLIIGGSLSLLHLIIAITPLYDFIVRVLLNSPEAIIEPARLALLFMSPWTLAIGYRRFQQGTMIRFGRAHMVGETTIVRLLTVGTVLTVGMLTKRLPGVLLAGLAQGLGVSCEAIFAGLRIRKIVPDIKTAPPTQTPLTTKRFISFFTPLALTSTIWLLWQPVISGAVSRMPDPVQSLAIWSVVASLLFVFRSPGVAYNEAVVALLEEPHSFSVLRKFALTTSLAITGLMVVFVLTPLSQFWFSTISNLSVVNVSIARIALALGLSLTFLSMMISFYQGIIVYFEKTKPVAEAVVIFLLSLLLVLILGVLSYSIKGVYVATAAFSLAHLMQALWLMLRSKKQRQKLAVDG
jgi:hypothetical protein